MPCLVDILERPTLVLKENEGAVDLRERGGRVGRNGGSGNLVGLYSVRDQ